MTENRRRAAAAGTLFLLTHVTSVAALVLYGPVLGGSHYLTSSVSDDRLRLGALLEVVLAVGVVGTGVALYPVVLRHGPALGLGYVGLRTLEAAVIAVGVVPLLAVVALRGQLDGAGPDQAGALVAMGDLMASLHDATFLVGPGLVCAVDTAVLALLLRRSGLVAGFIPVLGLVGGPLLLGSSLAVLFGVYGQDSGWAAVAALPVFAWELCLALHLLVRGVRAGTSPAAASPGAVRLAS